MTDYYLLLLLAALSADTVVPSYLPQDEVGPIPALNIDAITNGQAKQQEQSIPLDFNSVGGSDDHLGTGEGTRVTLNHDDRPVHASNGHQPPPLSFNSPSPKSPLPDPHYQDFLSTTQAAELSPYPEPALPGRRFYCCAIEKGKLYCKEMLDIKTVIVKFGEDRADAACYGEVWDCPEVITTSFSTDCLRRDSRQTNEVLELLERYSIPALIWFYKCLFLIGDFMECVWPTGTWDY